jgi:hypothetical protein
MRLTIDLTRSRVETKYSVAAEDLAERTRLIPVDEREDYGVLTHYFDRTDGSLARGAIDDPFHCTKVRTRQYPGDAAVWFEVKTRSGCWTRKSRVRLSRSEATRLVRGLSSSERESFGPLHELDGDDEAEARFHLRALAEGELVPVGAVYAFRKTYLVRGDQVRITLDQEIAYYRLCDEPYSAQGATAPELLLRSEPGLVLEVKHAGAVPPWCRDLLSGLRRSRYSKFRNLIQSLSEARRAAERVDRL